MSTSTSNYGLVLPAVNDPVDQDVWGNELNGDVDDIDGLLATAIRFVKSLKTTSFSVTAPTSTSTATGSSKTLFLCDATSGNITATLPTASAAGDGFTIAFKKTDSSTNTIIITPNGVETIDGNSTKTLSSQYDYCVIISDGSSAWNIISETSAIPETTNGLVHLHSINASGASSVIFDSTYITGTYTKYQLEFEGVYGSSAGSDLLLTVSTNDGGLYQSTNYVSAGAVQANNSTSISGTQNSSGSSSILLTLASNGLQGAAATAGAGTMKFSNPSSGATPTMFLFDWNTGPSVSIPVGYNVKGYGSWIGAVTAINNIKIAPSGGTVTGIFRLYGLAT